MSNEADDALQDYLQELQMFAQELPAEQRAELLSGIKEHISTAQEAGEITDSASTRAFLDRLGRPELLVQTAASSADTSPKRNRVANRVRVIGRETVALLLITLGSFIPVLGWLAGVALAWGSDRLQRREKLLLTLVVPLGPLGAYGVIFGYLAGKTSVICSEGSYGTTDGLNGPVTSTVIIPRTCTHPAMPPLLGLFIALIIGAAAVIVPVVVWLRLYKRTTTHQPLSTSQNELRPVPAS
jgi:hypothetical protein